MSKNLPENFIPRLLTISQAAAYWAVSRNTFKKLVRDGVAPGPLPIALGRLVFDREQQDRAINALSGEKAKEADLDAELAEFLHGKG